MKLLSKILTTFSILVIAGLSAMAQGGKPVTVTGVVSDNKGPVPGVLVYQENQTTNGTVTDGNGAYTITAPSNATLVFSSMGFSDVKEVVGGRKTINVTMKEDALLLEAAEVVSVGYGSVAKRDLTGSVAKVDMDEIRKSPIVNFDQAIQGRIAGVVVSTGDGSVGAAAEITIRGNNSLTQSSAPLYVIDGFPTESSLATSLNPADIQSIDVLKDASATAIYGARGANGVIVITTKQGVEGKPTVSFSASWTGSTITKKMDLLGAYDFVALQDEWYTNRGTNNIYLMGYDEEGHRIQNYYTLDDYRDVPTTDWQSRIYRTALQQTYNVSLSGGSKKSGTRYNVSLSAVSTDGIIVNSNFSRYQGKFNFSQKLGKRFNFDFNANYSRSITLGTNPTSAQNSSSASGWLMYSVWGYRPTTSLASGTVDDEWLDQLVDTEIDGANDYRFNPAKSVQNEYRNTTVDYLAANGAITCDIVTGLRLKISGGYTTIRQTRTEFNGSQTYTGFSGSSSGQGINGAVYNTGRTSWLNENILTWNKTAAKNHHINLLGGVTFQGETSNYNGVKSIRMSTEALGINGMHTGTYLPVVPWERDWTLMSFLARVNYNYKYKYYFTASFRADGSSKFPKDNRWGFFPSASVAWNFNREDWLKDSRVINNGKIRFSWGQTGNNRTTTPYDFYSQFTTTPGSATSLDYVFDGKIVPGYYPNNMANPNLRWETTEQLDIGLDLAFFKNRIKFTGDVYLKNTYNLLLNTTLPASSGYTAAMINIGSMQNRGLELTIEGTPVRRRNFEWSLNFNIAFNRNTVTGLTDNQRTLLTSVNWDQRFNSQYPYITQVGMPSGMMYGFIYEGTYKPEDFDGSALKRGIPYMETGGGGGKTGTKPGDPRYRDINEDGIIDDNDRTIIGCGQPLNTGGFGTNLNFYGFDFSVFFNWSFGNDVLNANRLIFENPYTGDLNQFSSVKDRYTSTNTSSNITRMGANGTFVYSSRVVEDASFLRLKSIALGYTIPSKVLQKVKIQNIRVYVSAENVWTLTNYSGQDPEVSTRNSVLTPGFDWSAYPRAYGITGGLNITF